MKRNTKITIAALCTMFVMAIAVATMAFSNASRSDNNATMTDANEMLFADGSLADTYTNIDNIIANSRASATDADKKYHIVEIGSSSTPSGLEDYVLDGKFEEFVLNSYSTKYEDPTAAVKVLKTMAPDCITYNFFKASDLTNDNEAALAILSKADLIYVSNDIDNPYAYGNDLSEDVFDFLREYAVGSDKPLIIDAPTATANSGAATSGSTLTITNLVDEYFEPMGKYRYTFGWDKATQSVSEFLQHKNGSMYLGINGNSKYSNGNWSEVYDNADINATGVKSYKVSKVLAVSTGSDKGNAVSILTEDASATPMDLTANKLYDADGNEVVADNWYDITGKAMSLYGYNRRYKFPDYVQLDTVALNDISVDFELDKYDMIIFEDSAAGVVISSEVYTKFVGALYSNLSIVYPKSFVGGTVAPDDMTSELVSTSYNAKKLYNYVSTAKGESKYPNVMNTTRNKFSVITAGTDKGTAKVIADLINSSSYRGIGGTGSGSTASMFTVLEIQPCYPIDRELAKEIGTTYPRNVQYTTKLNGTGTDTSNYYIYPIDVINGKTKEQLDSGVEYYSWELSEAKLADAFGLDVKQVNLIHMSSEELASNKKEIYGNVDLIYIGGNNSAIKNAKERVGFYSFEGQEDKVYYAKLLSNSGNDETVAEEKLSHFPIYDLYTHNGELVPIGFWEGVASGTPLGNIKGSDIGMNSNPNTLIALNGNDISYANYEDLSKYVKAGLPVVISSTVSDAYDTYKAKNNLQNSLDPQSNMVKLLNECANKENVFWGFLENAVVDRDNDAGRLGDTMTGYVSVFARSTGDTSDSEEADPNADPADPTKRDGKTIVTGNIDKVVATCKGSKQRPKLTVTSMPPRYSMYDESTKLSNRNLEFKYRVSGTSKYVVSLYIDDDGNSKFDRSIERVATSSTDTLKYTVADEFNGPLYWMLEVVDSQTGLSTYTTNIAFIKAKEMEKQTVRILQILPGKVGFSDDGSFLFADASSEGVTGKNNLYFCVECQRALERLEFQSVSTDSGNPRTHFETIYDGKYTDFAKGLAPFGADLIYLGKHMHRFGIVPYESAYYYSFGNGGHGADDWSSNLADEVSDLYDFEIDIMLREEYEYYAKEIRKEYDTSKMLTLTKNNMIRNFNLDLDAEEKAAYNAMTTDEKVVFIKKKEFEQKADRYYQMYQLLKREEITNGERDSEGTITVTRTVKQAEKQLIEELRKVAANPLNKNVMCDAYNKYTGERTPIPLAEEIENVIASGIYSDLYSISTKRPALDIYYLGYQKNLLNIRTVQDIYRDYALEHDKMVEAYELYKKYTRLAAGAGEWLQASYDCVIIGPSELFDSDDIKDVNAIADLKAYVQDNGKVLLFHDTLTPFTNVGSTNLTANLLDSFGNDTRKLEVDKTANPQSALIKYVTKPNVNPDKYFMTNYSPLDVSDPNRYTGFADAVQENSAQVQIGGDGKKYYQVGTTIGNTRITSQSYSDCAVVFGRSNNRYYIPYRYVEGKWDTMANQDQKDAKFTPKSTLNYGTNRASQNNEGIVTLYPFTLSSELSVSPTHTQTYAVDVEDPDMSVWYSLAGGLNSKVNNSESNSSYYAADPRDGVDNYFIYSYKNVTFCGAGHAKICGVAKDNNDERKLYINIICNSVRKSIKQPSIFIYDFQKDTCGDKIKKSENGEYFTRVDKTDEYTDFNFRVITDETTKLKSVRIYFDLDYSETNPSSAYVQNDNHKLIASWDSTKNRDKVEAGLNVPVFRYDMDILPRYDKDGHTIPAKYIYNGAEVETRESMLQLQPEYFDKYDGYHTYIVIEATDSSGKKTYQRLKIMLKETLFNLT